LLVNTRKLRAARKNSELSPSQTTASLPKQMKAEKIHEKSKNKLAVGRDRVVFFARAMTGPTPCGDAAAV
jgi:hypothetical protein